MIYSFVFNLLFVLMIGICGYYTVLYGKLSDDISELKSIVQRQCKSTTVLNNKNNQVR